MKIKPIGKRVVLKTVEEEEKTKSGIYLPKSDDKKEGIVVEVGTLSEEDANSIKKGDRVMYSGYSNEEIELNGEKYIVVDFKDIIAKVESENE